LKQGEGEKHEITLEMTREEILSIKLNYVNVKDIVKAAKKHYPFIKPNDRRQNVQFRCHYVQIVKNNLANSEKDYTNEILASHLVLKNQTSIYWYQKRHFHFMNNVRYVERLIDILSSLKAKDERLKEEFEARLTLTQAV
jgi:hypothetical protein